jgi:hypothetical protein
MSLDPAEQPYDVQVEQAKQARGAVLVEVVCPECGAVVGAVVDTPLGPLYEATFPQVEGQPPTPSQHVLILAPRYERPGDEMLRGACEVHGRLVVSDALARDAVRQGQPRLEASSLE